jgi:hypothetical protein
VPLQDDRSGSGTALWSCASVRNEQYRLHIVCHHLRYTAQHSGTMLVSCDDDFDFFEPDHVYDCQIAGEHDDLLLPNECRTLYRT